MKNGKKKREEKQGGKAESPSAIFKSSQKERLA